MKKLSFTFKNPVPAIYVEAKCCFDPQNKKANIIFLDTLTISSNFLEFYWLSVFYKKLNYIASYIYIYIYIYIYYLLGMSIIMFVIIVIVKGSPNYYHFGIQWNFS